MIHGLPEDSLVFIFDRMSHSQFDFYLTGSRKHHPTTVIEESDYDFWTQDSPEVRNYLQSIGISIASTKESHYPTLNTSGLGYFVTNDEIASTFKNPTVRLRYTISHSPIHIQLVENVEAKRQAEATYHTITALNGMRSRPPMSKNFARMIWARIYENLGIVDSSIIRVPKTLTLEALTSPSFASSFPL